MGSSPGCWRDVDHARAGARDHAGGTEAVPYDASLPGCDDSFVLGNIASRFATKESRFWTSSLTISELRAHPADGVAPQGLDYIPRRYCSGIVVTSDGLRRRIDYSIREDLGFIGAGLGHRVVRGRARPRLFLRSAMQAGEALTAAGRRCSPAPLSPCLLALLLPTSSEVPARAARPAGERAGGSTSTSSPCPGRRVSASSSGDGRRRANARRTAGWASSSMACGRRTSRATRASASPTDASLPRRRREARRPLPGRGTGALPVAQARHLLRRSARRLISARSGSARERVRDPGELHRSQGRVPGACRSRSSAPSPMPIPACAPR